MRKKALDAEPLTYMTMMVCYELGKTEQEISSWTLADIYRWIAFFRLKSKAEAKAVRNARKNTGTGNSGKSRVIVE